MQSLKSTKRSNSKSAIQQAVRSVLPEALEERKLMAATIIMDNTSAGVVQTGTWNLKTGQTGAYNSDYLHDAAAAKGSKAVTYTPTIATAGQYQVYAWWQASTIRPTNVPYIVTSTAGSTTVPENQQLNGGKWNLLGTYNFAAGKTGSVKISNTGTAAGTYVTADAVEFVPVVSGGTGSTPYTGTAVAIPGKIEAENFDKGGEAVAYHDTDTANLGGSYRTTEGVDIEPSTDIGAGYNIGHVNVGEWMQYSVSIAKAGSYVIGARLAADAGFGGSFHYTLNGVDSASTTFSNTGGWQSWQTINTPAMTLPAGTYQLRITFDTANSGNDVGNFNWLQVAPAASQPLVSITAPLANATVNSGSSITITATASESGGTIKKVDFYQGTTLLGSDTTSPYSYTWTGAALGSYNLTALATDANGIVANSTVIPITVAAANTQGPYGGTPVSVPGTTIYATNYDLGGEGVAYHDIDTANRGGASYRPADGVDIQTSADPGNGFEVGHIATGEWLRYTINVGTTGNYEIKTRMASGGGGGVFHYEIDGVKVGGHIVVANTGGWDKFQTISSSGRSALTAGTHVLRLFFDSSLDGGEIADLNSISITPAFTASAWPTTWTYGANAPIARFESVGHMLNGKVYQFGGFKNSSFQVTKQVDVYDIASNTWKTLKNMPAGVAESHQGVADDGTYIYFAGGYMGDLLNTTPSQVGTATVWRYNPANDSWLQMPSLPAVRGAGELTYLNGVLHYWGGNPADRVTNLGDHYTFNLAGWNANASSVTSWGTAASMPNPRDHSSAVVLNGLIYSIGGELGHDVNHVQQADTWAYNPVTNTWKQLSSMPIAKSHTEGGTFAYNGRIIWASGQIENFNSTDNVVEYDPITDSWATLPLLPAPREGASVSVWGNKVVYMLGGYQTNAPTNTVFLGTIPTTPAPAMAASTASMVANTTSSFFASSTSAISFLSDASKTVYDLYSTKG